MAEITRLQIGLQLGCNQVAPGLAPPRAGLGCIPGSLHPDAATLSAQGCTPGMHLSLERNY
jgi:hypothetical protein